ncbi:MAG: 30S ribosomal protein S14 [Gammaproteobacteria bacterium]
MAKRSMLEREKRRKKAAARDHSKRQALRATIKSLTATDEEKAVAVIKLQKMPRDGSVTRQRNRCAISGRPHGYYRKFGLGRNMLREAAMNGEIPGLRKASW